MLNKIFNLFLGIISIVCFGSCNQQQPFASHISVHPNPQTPLAPSLYLDSIPFVVNQDLKYTIYLKNDTITYQLVVNASDTIEIGPFDWDEGRLKSVFYLNGDSSTYIGINANEYLLSIPHNSGWSQLIKVQQKNGQWKIDSDKDSWLTSEAGFVYISKKQIVAYPNFRATYSGKVTYWKYIEGTGKFKFLKAVETGDCMGVEMETDCVMEIVKNIN